VADRGRRHGFDFALLGAGQGLWCGNCQWWMCIWQVVGIYEQGSMGSRAVVVRGSIATECLIQAGCGSSGVVMTGQDGMFCIGSAGSGHCFFIHSHLPKSMARCTL